MIASNKVLYDFGTISFLLAGLTAVAGANPLSSLGEPLTTYVKSHPTLSESVAQAPGQTPANPQAPAAPAAPPAGPPAPSTPGMSGPITMNPHPTQLDLGPLGKVFVGGALSGLALWQDKPANGDLGGIGDLSNGQIFLNKTDGPIQFFLQAGAYSLPSLGTPYMRAEQATRQFYGALPQGFIKFVPNDNLSLEVGKLPTLVGAEYTFTFENMNIARGLLWNQENAVNRGVQLNYSKGPLTVAASYNDGFYSDVISWIWLSVTDVINKNNTVALIGGGNTIHTNVATAATPLFQNNEQIYNLIFTHTTGSWTFQPYLQYTNVPKIASIGANASASTTGVALLADYDFSDKATLGGMSLAGVSLPFRLEYIGSTGSTADGAPNLLYGPGSSAWSATITPTYRRNLFFARAELSYMHVNGATAGLALGSNGNANNQSRLLLELGIVF